MTGRAFLLSLSMFFASLLGCASSQQDAEQSRSVKPIDRVRDGFVQVSEDLKKTLVSAQAMSAGDRRARKAFSSDLRGTEKSVEMLRADAADLRSRAADYMLLWSGKTMTVTGDSHAPGVDGQRSEVKQKYDQLVDASTAAKDKVVPLLDEFQSMESMSDGPVLRDAVKIAGGDTDAAIKDLNEARARLDELKAIAQSGGE